MSRIICALLVPALLGLTVPEAHAETVAEVQAKLKVAMDAWAKLRGRRIEVRDITGLKASEGEKAQLEARRKTVVIKQRSNREWKGYWKAEAKAANKIKSYYELLAPSAAGAVGTGLLETGVAGLTEARDSAAVEAKTDEAEVKKLEAGLGKARDWLKGEAKAAAAAAASAETKKATEGLVAKVMAAQKLVDNLEPRVAQAAEAGKAAAVKRLSEAKAALVIAQQAVTKDTAAAAARDARIEASAKFASVRVAVGLPKAAPNGLDAEALARVDTLLKWKEASEKRDASSKRHALAVEALKAVTTPAARLRIRIGVLTTWVKLATDKQGNQDLYMAALTADFVAVEERLQGLTGQTAPEMLGRSKKACQVARKKTETSLEKYYACTNATKQELGELDVEIGNTEAVIALNDAQGLALDKLVAAQKEDHNLVQRELKLAEDESIRATDADFERPQWREIWSTYTTRAGGKEVSLRAALTTSEDTRRLLGLNDSMLASDLKNHRARHKVVAAALEERSSVGGLAVALLKTAWQFVSMGYMVPVYLLIAWLLLRLGVRVEEKVVAKARENQSNVDAVQRVETLSTVARGGFKLVVYIATVLMCLVAVSVDIAPLLGGAAIFGLAISFGSQSLVKDVVTGFFILLEDQFSVGDYISTGGTSGTVEKVTLRRTVLRDMTGTVHTVPNGAITSVSNMTQGWNRVVINLGVAYGTDLDKVEKLINELGDAFFAEEEWAAKLHEPPRYVGMTKFDASAIVFRLMFKTQQGEQWGAERAFNVKLKKAFEAEGIEIPYDKLDVTVITPEGAAAPAS